MTRDENPESVLSRATAKLEAARREVEAWQDFISRFHSLNAVGEAAKRHDADDLGGDGEGGTRQARAPKAHVMETDRRVEVILRREGRPTKSGPLVRLLAEDGFPVGGVDPANKLSARLSRSSRFVNIKDRGWWITGNPIPDEVEAPGPDIGPGASKGQSPHG